MKRSVLIVVLAVVVFSCGTRKVVTKKDTKQTNHEKVETRVEKPETTNQSPKKVYASAAEKYIDTYSAIAQDEMRLYKIPASITLAQGILESGSGKGRLSVKANNHFGIKCHNWNGAKIYHDDDKKGECFRKYNNAKYSFRDHSLFLTGRKRYSNLFTLKPNNYKGWAKGLRAAGYATDKKYPQKLISLIERYQLYKYDDEVLNMKSQKKETITKETLHVVSKGDTLYSISKLYNTSVTRLKNENGLENNTISIGQVLKIKK